VGNSADSGELDRLLAEGARFGSDGSTEAGAPMLFAEA
jgi:hypothetical protein